MIRDIIAAGECGAYVRFGTDIDLGTSRTIQAFASALRALRRPEITDIVPGYVSLYIEFDVLLVTLRDVQRIVEGIDPIELPRLESEPVIEVGVYYGGEYGPDLAQVAADCRMSEADVVDIHSSSEYEVFFLGFTPGFPFLGVVDERIAVPRLARPRTRVPAGAVGMAGRQTGVYPVASPGGWRLIGRTPDRMVDLSGPEPQFLLIPGRRVRFVPRDPGGFSANAGRE
ncbi:MAG: 5-oxoprolinase subunit PxpB [Candidatus Dormiibacterota bacterium]